MMTSALSSLKLVELRTLALKLGLSVSGTKPILTQLINHEIATTSSAPQPKASDPHLRILSIDMGIRNLAYCLIDAPATDKPGALPQIKAWQRLAVSSKPLPLVTDMKLIDPAKPTPKQPRIEVKAMEPFDPATLSKTAYSLIKDRLLPLKPTHVLIERQRFRSASAAQVLEWTLRVNMFESMIYSILTTLQSEGLWNGTILPIAPGKIGPYWLGLERKADENIAVEEYKRISKTKNIKAINKGKKIDLVRTWLARGDMVGMGNTQVEKMAEMYKEKWGRKSGGPTGPRKIKALEKEIEHEMEKKGIPKLDDLADCLLQGMAWLDWQRNRRVLIEENGVTRLLSDPDNERLESLVISKRSKS